MITKIKEHLFEFGYEDVDGYLMIRYLSGNYCFSFIKSELKIVSLAAWNDDCIPAESKDVFEKYGREIMEKVINWINEQYI